MEITWSPGVKLEQVEQQVIIAALTHFGGHRKKSAESLGISLRTITTRIGEYEAAGIDVPEAGIMPVLQVMASI